MALGKQATSGSDKRAGMQQTRPKTHWRLLAASFMALKIAM